MTSYQRRDSIFVVVVLCFLIGSIQSALAQDEEGPVYTIYMSKVIRPGFDISFTISITDSSNPVRVTSRFSSSDVTINFQDVTIVASESNAQITLGRLPLDYDGAKQFTLNVEGEDTVTGNQTFSENATDYQFESKALSILIQSDKAIYQPGEKIQFRAICLSPELTPLSGAVDYQVQDPNGNIVLLAPNTTLSNGVAGGELQLIRDSAQGDWKITFTYQNFMESIDISVQIYKLPKFEVEITAPSFIHSGSSGLTINLKATYTFGQPVSGSAVLRIQEPRRFFFGGSPRQNIIRRSLFPYDGDEDIFIPIGELMRSLGWNGRFTQQFEIYAEVTEALTEETFNNTAMLAAHRYNIKVDALQKPEVIKPGLIYQALIQVSEQDGEKLMDSVREQNNLVVVADYRYPRPFRPFPVRPIPINQLIDEEPENATLSIIPTTRVTTTPPPPPPPPTTYVFEIPPSGIVALDILARDDDFSSVSFSAYTNATASDRGSYQYWSASRAESPSESFLQVSAVGEAAQGEVEVGNNVQVIIRTTDVVPEIRVVILSRGLIIDDAVHQVPNPDLMESTYSFVVTSEMTPSVQVVASYVGAKDEVIADVITINTAVALANQVTISSPDPTSVDAGTDLSIRVDTSSAGAYVGIRAIDQSVLLLRSGNDITKERVVSDLQKYSSTSPRFNPNPFFFSRFPFYSGARSAAEVFRQAGVIVLTNALVHGSRRVAARFPPSIALPFVPFGGGRPEFAFEVARGPSPPNSVDAIDTSGPDAPRVRSLFPESWIWTEGTTGTDGSYTINVTSPDTITSWIVSAFSVSDQVGLGIANTYKLTVFREFFVSLNLPLKITRGEIIIVQAIVFNYLEEDIEVNVILWTNNINGVTLLRPGNNKNINGAVRRITVPSGGAASVKYPVRINTLGEVPITVYAFGNGTAADAIERKVFVRPGGIQQCYSVSSLIDLNEDEKDRDGSPTFTESLRVQIPDGIVVGSEKVTLHAYGNIMESSMSNLGRLLRAPGGCGEQNMISFAPDVFVTLYLDRIGQLDPETEADAYQHIMDGYINELNYKREDGSFSAFGSRDDSGSTWLTAFVTKCFLFARQLRPSLVEGRVLDQAIDFVVTQQSKSGEFREPGRVIHRDMQGGVNSPVTMTAYVLIALTETGYASTNRRWQSAINSARAYLESNLNQTLDDIYALSLVTYALHVSQSSSASFALAALDALATTEGGFKYWHVDNPESSSYSSRWRPPYLDAQTNDIEMTSYALLTYVRRNDIGSAIPVLKWLVSKQNDLGGYSSTQDTVLAIQALSSVAFLLTGRQQNLDISFTHSADAGFQEMLTINDNNANVFYTYEAPSESGSVVVSATGLGIGVAQLSVCYNVPEDPFDQEPFVCSANVTSSNTNSANIKFCCALHDGMEETGMFVFEIQLLNGFTVDVQQAEANNKGAKMIELDDGRVNIYFDSLAPEARLCANIILKRSADVAAVKPATLSAYDYYKPDKRVSFLYNVDGLRESGPCQVCGSDCVGCAAPVLREWSEWSPCVEFCRPETSNRSRTCYDPNLQVSVHPSRCDLRTNPVEERPCSKDFSCPITSSGLWFDLPFKFSRTPFPSQNCRFLSSGDDTIFIGRGVPIGRSPRSLIPGAILDGEDEYLNCFASGFSTFVSRNNYRVNPFTLSILIRPESYNENTRTVLLEAGRRNEDPVMSFEKLAGSNEMRFSVYANSNLYQVTNINAIAIGQWTHVMLRWNPEEGARVYINGFQNGNVNEVAVSSRSINFPNINIGAGFNGTSPRGYFNGSVSSFNFWSSSLSTDEIEGLSDFYFGVFGDEVGEPVLSIRELRSFLETRYERCITSPSILSELYELAPPCEQTFGFFPEILA